MLTWLRRFWQALSDTGPGSLHATRMWCIEEEARIRRMRAANREDGWRTLADLERRGILTPTVKYKTLEWLTSDD